MSYCNVLAPCLLSYNFQHCRQNDRLGMEPVPPMQEAVQVGGWVWSGRSLESMTCLPSPQQTHLIESHADLDPDVFKSMTSLGCFKDKHALLQALLSPE